MGRFLGHEPGETHTTTTVHPDGTTTVSTTTVVREPEWNDTERQTAYDLYDDANDRCKECGQPRDVCSNPDTPYYPQLTYCWAAAARDAARRRWGWMQKDKKPDKNTGYTADDGASIWAAPFDLDPENDFLKHAPMTPPD